MGHWSGTRGFSFEQSQGRLHPRLGHGVFIRVQPTHRGIPGSPGRSGYLSRRCRSRVLGASLTQVTGDSLESIFSYLDDREKGGFSRHQLDFYPKADRADRRDTHRPPISNTYVYVAQDDNPNYLGPAPVQEMALQIFFSTGPKRAE